MAEPVMKPKMTFDPEANACYIRIDGELTGRVVGGCRTVAVSSQVNLDYDNENNLIGVEILL